MNNQPVIFETVLHASAEKIWNALTVKENFKQWYFDISEFKPEVGFEFSFTGGNEDRTYLHICKILEIVPYKIFKHSWRYNGFEGNSFVTWELFEEDNSTRVKLTHEGLEAFSNNGPDFVKENFVMGWTHIVDTSLKNFVEK